MATKGKATFKHNRKANCITLEAVLVRSDGAIQVRAVVPYEKAKAFFAALEQNEKAVVMGGCGGSVHHASQALAARAAVGLVQDAADFAADRFAAVLSGWNPFRRKKRGGGGGRGGWRAQARRRGAQAQKPGGGEGEGGGGGGGGGGEGEGGGDEDQEQQDDQEQPSPSGAAPAPEGSQDARRNDAN